MTMSVNKALRMDPHVSFALWQQPCKIVKIFEVWLNYWKDKVQNYYNFLQRKHLFLSIHCFYAQQVELKYSVLYS